MPPTGNRCPAWRSAGAATVVTGLRCRSRRPTRHHAAQTAPHEACSSPAAVPSPHRNSIRRDNGVIALGTARITVGGGLIVRMRGYGRAARQETAMPGGSFKLNVMSKTLAAWLRSHRCAAPALSAGFPASR